MTREAPVTRRHHLRTLRPRLEPCSDDIRTGLQPWTGESRTKRFSPAGDKAAEFA
jgi:hypothetical protein